MSRAVFAVLLVMSFILTVTTILVTVSPFVDKFSGKISSMDVTWEGEATFPTVADTGFDMFTWFYTIPIFFCYFFILWMFKVVIWKHIYSREDRGGENYEI